MARVLDSAVNHLAPIMLLGILLLVVLVFLLYPGLCVGQTDQSHAVPVHVGPMCTI